MSTAVPRERPVYCSTFTKYTPKTFRQKPIATFDCETADGTLLGPLAGIAFTSDHDFPNIVKFNNHENIGGPSVSFLKHVLTKRYRGYVIYAHKGLSFDLSHMFADQRVTRWLTENGFSVHIDRSFVIIRKHKMAWAFADSFRIVQEKLDNILKAFAPQYTKIDLPKGPFSWFHPQWTARITNDTLGLYVALKEIQKLVRENFNVPLSLTSSATALRAARLIFPIEKVKRPCRKALDWIRAGAYSGGRIEVFHQGEVKGNIRVFDINSAYAWALKGEFPLDAGYYTISEPTSGMYIGRCAVFVPEGTSIPPVLSRLYHHNFPVGSFQSMLTNEEVAFARSSGATVTFLEGWTWRKTAPVFSQFIEQCERVRMQDYHGPKGKLVKLMQNSLYGILGMSPLRRIQRLTATDPGSPWTHAFNTDTQQYVHNIYENLTWKESPNQMPHWAAFITARVRVRLTEYLHLFEREGHHPLYCHTDSIWTVSPNGLTPAIKNHLSSMYGGLKIEQQGDRAVIIAPGEALLISADGPHVASKGWPGKDHIELFEHDIPTKIPQTIIYRAGTALKRECVGRNIDKKVVDYLSMRNRRSARSLPGATAPKIAPLFDYSYWHYENWFPGKVWTIFPRSETALRLDPSIARITAADHRRRIHRNRSVGQQHRKDREFAEGYHRYLLDQQDRTRYNFGAGKIAPEKERWRPHGEAGEAGEERDAGSVEAHRGEESPEGDQRRSTTR